MRKEIIWHCDFCIFEYNNRKYTENHERECYYNPEAKACDTCGNAKYRHFLEEIDELIICAHQLNLLVSRKNCPEWRPKIDNGDLH